MLLRLFAYVKKRYKNPGMTSTFCHKIFFGSRYMVKYLASKNIDIKTQKAQRRNLKLKSWYIFQWKYFTPVTFYIIYEFLSVLVWLHFNLYTYVHTLMFFYHSYKKTEGWETEKIINTAHTRQNKRTFFQNSQK